MAGFNAFLKNNNIITGTAIPTEGNFKTGDIIVNVGPNSATEPMWICNEGGNPGIWGPVGVGSGSIVSINSSVLISEPTNEVSLASLGVGVSSKDKLLVHYNSTHLLEGVHFEISNDGSKIVKLGGGNWNPEGLENCIFALELFKGVESIDGDKIVVDSKMTCKTNHVVIENACSEVEIGIEGFNAGNDMMLVFKNGVNMVEGVDYELQGSKIVSTGEVWNENGIEDYGMTFVVFKEVVEYNGDAEVKAENIADGSIGMDKLGEDVREAIEDASNIDLSGYATKEEMNGKVAQDAYDAKIAELEGRVNEAFTNANNGKQLIANAIGEPVSVDDTFSAMSNDINGLLSTFKTNMMNNGVTVESGDKFKELIEKIKGLTEGEGNKGIQYAEGTKSVNISGTFDVEIPITTNLDFTPTYIFAIIPSGTIFNGYSSFTNICVNNLETVQTYSKISDYGHGPWGFDSLINDISSSGFNVNIHFVNGTGLGSGVKLQVSGTVKWYAIGVGEEDTTLLDSLKSILAEEGVTTTEEDDMASLITKVDEEFNDKNTEMSSLNTNITLLNNQINSLTSELAGKVTPAGTATAGHVLQGSTFMNSSGQLQTGTVPYLQSNIPNVTDYTANHYMTGEVTVADLSGLGGNCVYFAMPTGVYNTVGWLMSYTPNLRPENIVSGVNILGVVGTCNTYRSYKLFSVADTTITIQTSTNTYTIAHGLGVVPIYVAVGFQAVESHFLTNLDTSYSKEYYSAGSKYLYYKITGVDSTNITISYYGSGGLTTILEKIKCFIVY